LGKGEKKTGRKEMEKEKMGRKEREKGKKKREEEGEKSISQFTFLTKPLVDAIEQHRESFSTTLSNNRHEARRPCHRRPTFVYLCRV